MEIINYPILFHKYLLNISNKEKELEYVVNKKMLGPFKDKICHLHIYDLSKFNFFFGSFVSLIDKEYTIIITYCIGDIINDLNYDIVYIKIKNKGYDIGGKIALLDYLYSIELDYKYILFLHSKSSKIKRYRYFTPLISKLNEINEKINKDEEVLGVFPDTLWVNHNNVKNYKSYDVFRNNHKYWDEFLGFIGCKNRIKLFSEGNCMILHKKVIDYIFKDRCKLLYNILNDEESFDYSWFVANYKRYSDCQDVNSKVRHVNFIYQEFLNKKLFGNNNGLKNSASSHPDGMIEHVFERIWINVIIELNGECLISHNNNIISLKNIIKI